jgi:peptidoglycan hydrolase CwlO-like protein
MHDHGDAHGGDDRPAVPSVFKYVLVASALFIASCSAFFSVWGLGLLFVGSAAAVMVMAASLEVGKLVAVSFLYRYWKLVTRPLKVYLTLAVLLLVGITSLGNYGFLARAYERTHTKTVLMENQIANLEREVADTQKEIDATRGHLTRISDADREDVTSLQQRMAQANDPLNQELARIQERRKSAQDRRDRDLGVPAQRVAEQGEVLKKAIAAEETAIAGLNDRVAGLDRAVDGYTKLGGPGFFKNDGIRMGQELRERQKEEREAIATELAEHRARIEQLRTDQSKQLEIVGGEIAATRDQFAQEMARLDAEEQELRKAHKKSISDAEKQLAALQSKGETTLATGDTDVEALYQRLRSRNEEIYQLRDQLASVDIGSYRFVARAFEAPADDVVKWLILALVLVFDPLAVSLVIGFNMALLGDRPRRRPASSTSSGADGGAEGMIPSPAAGNRWAAVGAGLLCVAVASGAIAAAGHFGSKALRTKARTSHLGMVPSQSFAVVTLRPEELSRSAPGQIFSEWLGSAAGKVVSDSMIDLMKNGFDPQADLYVFAKFPAKSPSQGGDRPVMLCGYVARLADPAAAEESLSRMADQLGSSLRGSSAPASALARSRAMIRYGSGRYMDPEGGFFTFGLTDRVAIMLVEFEGDPESPCVEDEMRLCLGRPEADTSVSAQAREQLPARARNAEGAISIWFDAGRFFSHLPKNPAAQARYQQLEQRLGFDLRLNVQPAAGDQLKVVGEYAYQFDRFKDRRQPSALEFLAGLGSSEAAGLGGRLMDRCMDTLDYDSLIARLRSALGESNGSGAQQVLVEKSFTSARDATFVLRVTYDPQAGPPLVAAVQTLFQ